MRELRTHTEELPALSLDRAAGVVFEVGWACGLCSVSDCSPHRRVATVARTTEGESQRTLPARPRVGGAERSPEWLVERGVFVVELDLGHPEAVAPLERSRQAIPLLTYEAGA